MVLCYAYWKSLCANFRPHSRARSRPPPHNNAQTATSSIRNYSEMQNCITRRTRTCCAQVKCVCGKPHSPEMYAKNVEAHAARACVVFFGTHNRRAATASQTHAKANDLTQSDIRHGETHDISTVHLTTNAHTHKKIIYSTEACTYAMFIAFDNAQVADVCVCVCFIVMLWRAPCNDSITNNYCNHTRGSGRTFWF